MELEEAAAGSDLGEDRHDSPHPGCYFPSRESSWRRFFRCHRGEMNGRDKSAAGRLRVSPVPTQPPPRISGITSAAAVAAQVRGCCPGKPVLVLVAAGEVRELLGDV